jgi:aminoglycoside phosphotransferase family enzyme/predicted kinase
MSSRPSDNPAASQEAVFRFLADPRTHGLSEPVGRVDTAAAVVFLAGPDAYKVKRAVTFPFMDLATLDKRRSACQAEIAVNRASAPGVYLAALPIRRSGERLAIDGEGEIVEWVVRMRRFDENATLDRVAARDGLSNETIDKLTLAIRRSHARAPLRDAAHSAHSLETYIEQNDAAFAERPGLFDATKARRLAVDSRLAFAVARPILLRRGESGFTRRCHGDLHLSNIVMLNGEPTLFDALEFSDEIASGDVLYDLAFLLMDLEELGLRPAANRLFNRYLAPEPPEAMAGLAALPLFLSLRAAIRAKVKAAGADRLEGAKRDEARALARGYFDCAAEFLRHVTPRLVAVGGLSGAGKSALAGALAPRLGRAPGALWLRSDLERKAMFAIEETAHLPASAYARDVTRDVYRRLADKTRIALRAGQAVVLDATFSTASERQAAAGAAAEVGVAFAGLFLNAPLAARLERIALRRADASDADVAVASKQTAEPLGERGWAALSASGCLGETTRLALARLSNA